MYRYGFVCLLAALVWSQATSSKPGGTAENSPAQTNAAPGAPAGQNEAPPASPKAEVPPDAAVITIKGLCASSAQEKTAAANCQTVITRRQFEAIMDAIQPNMPQRVRRQFATRYANALVMAKRAEEMGLDKGPDFDERMRLQRIQVLSMELNKALQEKASEVPDQAIQDYYRADLDKFVEVDVDRIYVPKMRQQPTAAAGKDRDPDDDKKPAAAEGQKSAEDAGQTMKNEADKLRAQAVAGADFAKLQAEAFQAAGLKSPASNVSLGKMRRSALPPNHVSIMDLKAGEISPVIADQSGYFIYKVKSIDTMPLDQAKEEIKGILRSQRMQDEMRSLQTSATPDLDEAYFGPAMPPRPLNGGPGASLPAGKPSTSPGPK
jgi:PPIC-type PPIASE domain